VKITTASTLGEVAVAVGAELARHGIRAVLTGGACVAIYTGTYTSKDADFVLQGHVKQRGLDEAMKALGFTRKADRYVHPDTPFFVEFPPGPLSIGDDVAIEPVQLHVGANSALALSATDSCRDRLAAFYHWNDRQALRLAVDIASAHDIDLDKIGAWSVSEGAEERFREFLRQVKRGRSASE
jgi:hypothetical protein